MTPPPQGTALGLITFCSQKLCNHEQKREGFCLESTKGAAHIAC